MKKIVSVMACCLLLTGCGRRELEDRSFPTVLTAATGNIRVQEEERQAESSKYIDYGHVKAVILSEEVVQDGEALREILSYLEDDPVFARSILMFVGDEEVLELAKEEEEETGLYLEELSGNQPKLQEWELPLKDFLNYFHNIEASVQIPVLRTKEGKLLPSGTMELTQEAVETMHIPVPRKRLDEHVR